MSDTEDDFGETGSINSDTDVDSEHGEMQEGNLSKSNQKIMNNHFNELYDQKQDYWKIIDFPSQT